MEHFINFFESRSRCIVIEQFLSFLNSDRPDQVLDRLIHKFDDHEESVYGLEWSACDAWVFASLSHDGRVVFNRVPQSEKYKILL